MLSVPFYACCVQIIDDGLMDMEQFLNPDGFGDDLPCEMF